jgi:hypothetical protein
VEVEGHRGKVGVLLDAFPVGQQPRIAGHRQQFLHRGPAFDGCHLGAVDRDQGLLGHEPWGVLLDVLGEVDLQVGNQCLLVGGAQRDGADNGDGVGSAAAGGMGTLLVATRRKQVRANFPLNRGQARYPALRYVRA